MFGNNYYKLPQKANPLNGSAAFVKIIVGNESAVWYILNI
jgi:hypothetical protein